MDAIHPNTERLAGEFRRTLEGIRKKHGKPPLPLRAGFYFISALYRLASVSARMRKRFIGWPTDADRQRLEMDVNKIKHDLQGHPEMRINTDVASALRVATALCQKLVKELGTPNLK